MMLYNSIMTDAEKPARRSGASYMAAWTAANPERAREIATRNYDKNAVRLRQARRDAFDLLKSAPCLDCGQTYPPYVMQFDHRDPEAKQYPADVSIMQRRPAIRDAELAKCDLVCANCHCKRTHQQRLAGRKFGGAPRTRERKA